MVRRWCEAHDVAWADIDVWDDDAPRRSAQDESERAGHLDLLVTLGGDGTFLRGVRVANAADCPVLGVDVGRVGFLTEVEVGDVETALEAVHHGGAQLEERLTLTMRASRPLELPLGMESLLRYGRGPALPPPRPRLTPGADVGAGSPSTSSRSTTWCSRSWPATARPRWGCTSATGSSRPTARTR